MATLVRDATQHAILEWLWTEFQWPPWASGCCVVLSMCLLLLHVAGKAARRSRSPVERCSNEDTSVEFQRFRQQYLIVYFLVMFADWLQGTHMYSLYDSYGMSISTLFLTGFLSSAVLGNVIGPMVDTYGRRKACLVFCVLEIVINTMENIPSMPVLLVGRVLGGISTSLLFSAFESWMVTEHRARGFSEEWIAKTFAIASEGNGLLAVLAGVIAQLTADAMGEIGPFRLAIGVTIVAMLFIYPWAENYGSSDVVAAAESSAGATNSLENHVGATSHWSVQVYAVGMCYSLFEGAMYVFVFLWYPTLSEVVPNAILPSGLVFSCFMLCTSIGGKLFDLTANKLGEEALAVTLCITSAGVFLIPMLTSRYEYILGGFLIFETCVGAYSPCSATLRSRYFPSDRLSTVLSTFRLPTNLLVVLGTGGSSFFARNELFLFCSLAMLCAAASGVVVLMATKKNAKTKTS